MNQELKKRLARNWFKILQDVICKEIEIIESRKKIFRKKRWFRGKKKKEGGGEFRICLLYTSPSPRDLYRSRMPSSA